CPSRPPGPPGLRHAGDRECGVQRVVVHGRDPAGNEDGGGLILLSKSEALRVILAAVPRPERVVEIPLDDALGYVLAEDAVADLDMPRFERSAVDGWAVRAIEVRAPGVTLR